MSARSGALAAPALPQVNLLPPEVRSARTLSTVKRWLGIAVVLSVVVSGLGVVYASLQESDAQAELARENGVTDELLAEQLRYAEAPRVIGQLDNIKAARDLGMSTEILWEDYLGAIAAVTPDEVTIEAITYTGASPITTPALPANVLAAPSVGVINFAGRAETVPDTAAWMDALESIPGFQDAWVNVAQIDGDEDVTYYQVTSSVQVHDTAYAKRFSTEASVEEDVTATQASDQEGDN